MTIIGIDPGPTERDHAAVLWDMEAGTVEKIPTWSIYEGAYDYAPVVIETMSPIGATLGQSTIDTIFETGRLAQLLESDNVLVRKITRRQVKKTLLGKVSGNDRDIKNALIERFGDPGTKKEPGVLYGITSHHLAALAVAVTYYDMKQAEVFNG